jgi:steroid delta-isomerase-like uncharacterized protein
MMLRRWLPSGLRTVLDDVGLGTLLRGKQEVKNYVRGIFPAIPNVKKELKSFHFADDHAACEMVETGTMTQAFGKIPATDKSYTVRAVWAIETQNGKISRLASYYDLLAFMRHVGLIPESPL